MGKRANNNRIGPEYSQTSNNLETARNNNTMMQCWWPRPFTRAKTEGKLAKRRGVETRNNNASKGGPRATAYSQQVQMIRKAPPNGSSNIARVVLKGRPRPTTFKQNKVTSKILQATEMQERGLGALEAMPMRMPPLTESSNVT
jgi:hypothetical protein